MLVPVYPESWLLLVQSVAVVGGACGSDLALTHLAWGRSLYWLHLPYNILQTLVASEETYLS